MHGQEVYLFVNLSSQLICFLLFNLASLQQLLNKVVLMDEHVVLCTSVLDCFGDFWEHVFNVGVHVLLCQVYLDNGLIHNLLDKVLVFDHFHNHPRCFLMAFNKVDNDII